MSQYFDVPSGSTLPIMFNTYASTGASVTITGLAVTDVEIYKGTSMTQRSSDNGYALIDTDGIDLDGITGIHGFSIDLSDNSDAGFYAVGSYYNVVVASITVNAVTVNTVVASFRIVAAENVTGLRAVDATAISGDTTAADNFETMVDGTGGQTLSLKQLNIVNSGGDAIVATASGSNGNGINASGNGTGAGIKGTGGATGHGASLVGGATSGDGLSSVASTSGQGITATGAGTTKPGILATGGATSSAGISAAGGGSGAGLLATGGATGHGVSAVGGATSGDGASIAATTSGNGLTTTGVGTTKHGINATGGATSSHGIRANGGGTGHGMALISGAGATGDGLNCNSASTNGRGMVGTGAGTGGGIVGTGGATGPAMLLTGGATSGDGVKAVTTSGHGINLAPVGTDKHGLFATGGNGGTSDGIKAVAGTGGVPIRGDITGNITGTLSGATGDAADITAIKAKTDNLPSDPADASVIAGRFDTLDTSVADLPTNAELTTALGTADDAVLAQVALVKAKTDSLTFTVAGKIDSNVLAVKGSTVTGSGTGLDPWGP